MPPSYLRYELFHHLIFLRSLSTSIFCTNFGFWPLVSAKNFGSNFLFTVLLVIPFWEACYVHPLFLGSISF